MPNDLPVKIHKEPVWESERTKMFVRAIILELVLYIGSIIAINLGVEIPTDTLNTVAASLFGLVSAWIWGRTKRNTPTPVDTRGYVK